MCRACFLVPDTIIGNDGWKHIHVLANRDTPLEDSLEAFSQKSDGGAVLLTTSVAGPGVGADYPETR